MKIIYILSFSVMILFTGCKSENPSLNNIVGKWVANDGAIIQLYKDGRFSTINLPKDKFLPFPDKYKDILFSESGNWKMKKEYDRWTVFLYFEKSEKLPLGCATQVFIAGEGVLENQPPWYLFSWEGEEGSFRYKLLKKE